MEKNKKTPERMCIVCREMKDKSQLLRIVKTADGQISIDKTGKANGRGAYICKSIQCLEKGIKTKSLNRSFSQNIDSSVYEKLREEFLDK